MFNTKGGNDEEPLIFIFNIRENNWVKKIPDHYELYKYYHNLCYLYVNMENPVPIAGKKQCPLKAATQTNFIHIPH